MERREEIEHHRRDLLNEEFGDLLTPDKNFVNTTTEEIETVLICQRDKEFFSAKEMVKGLRTWLRRQKGISPLKERDMWEIKPLLEP